MSSPHIHWFRDAAPYINAHRGATFVIEFGGEAVADRGFANLINDIALLNSLGVRLVLVYGARPQIEQRLKRQGVDSRYVQGLRMTDAKALTAVKEAAGMVRVEIEAQLSRGLVNTPMAGSRIRVASGNFVTAKPVGIIDGVDLGHTGEVRRIEQGAVRALLDAGNIVLLAPLGYSATGEVFNLRAEDVAKAVAVALNADKLIFMMEGPTLRGAGGEPLRELHTAEALALLRRRRKMPEALRHDIESAVDACGEGVHRVHLLSRGVDGALLQELYTRDGIGTLITAGRYEDLRRATIQDVGGILQLISPLEESGALARRSREQLELEINNFVVIERDGMIVGCAALYPYEKEQTGELACLVVHPDYGDQGRGEQLLSLLEEEAARRGLKTLFVLTTRTLHWFREHGFQNAPLEKLPIRKRRLYNYQRNSRVMIKTL